LGLSSMPLRGKTVALMFSKRSTRTRLASESSVALLGGHPIFLGSSDIQLGVNETLYDTSRVMSSMVDGIMARAGEHSEIQTLAETSSVPVINALSSQFHPTQILADLLTLIETYSNPFIPPSLSSLRGLTVAWIGDSNNVLNDMILAFPRLGINLQIATPKGYVLDETVIATSKDCSKAEGGDGRMSHSHEPLEALRGANVVVTDTWISMGQEEEKDRKIKDFSGFQITRDLIKRDGMKEDWKFMHCLPRKAEEVDDEVFYSDQSLVFLEAENRKWTTMALFALYFGRWSV